MSARELSWCRDLGEEALAGRLDPVVGREDLIWQALRILSRRSKRNVLFAGYPGVGKTALAEGVAQVLALGVAPPALRGAKVLSLDLGGMLSGTSFRGDFEGRVAALLKRLRDHTRPVVLFIDEIHLLLRAGRSEGGLDAANLLKPALARGEIVCMGASTGEEWRRIVEEDPALARRFTLLEVGEPGREQVLRMLEALRPRLELHHGVSISDEALLAALDLAPSGACPTRMPDRAIDRLDEACAGLQMEAAAQAGLCDPEPPRQVQTALRGRSFDLHGRAREIGLRGRDVRHAMEQMPAQTAERGCVPSVPVAAEGSPLRLLACHVLLDTERAEARAS